MTTKATFTISLLRTLAVLFTIHCFRSGLACQLWRRDAAGILLGQLF